MKEIYRNIAYTIIIGIGFFFFGTFIIFMFMYFLPGDPVAGYLAAMGIHTPTEEQYLAIKHQLGFDLPIIPRYFKFLGDLLTGNWRISFSPYAGENVFNLMGEKTLNFIDFLIVPLILGLLFGIKLGNISSKKRYSRSDKAIQVFCILGLSLPIFFFGMLLQFFMCDELGHCDPIEHFVASFIPFTLAVVTLITWQTRNYRIKYANEKSLIYNSINTGIIFSFIFLFYILIDITLDLSGFGILLLSAFYTINYFVIAAGLFVILILLILTILILNGIFIYCKFTSVTGLNSSLNSPDGHNLETEQENIVKIKKEDIKRYILKRLHSPIFVLGGLGLILFIFISIFPIVLTDYSLQEAKNALTLPWNGLDVLALIIWGIRDAFLVGFGALLIGLVGALIFCFFIWIWNFIKSRINSNVSLMLFCVLISVIVIGFIIFLLTAPIVIPYLFHHETFSFLFKSQSYLAALILFSLSIGLIFGVSIGLYYFIKFRVNPSNDPTFASSCNLDRVIRGLMITFYVLPGIIFVMLFFFSNAHGLGPFALEKWAVFYYLGVFLIPGFTLTISKGISRQINLRKVIKSTITNIPLGIALTLMIYFAIGFFGIGNLTSWNMNLGNIFWMARAAPSEALWGWIWSGITMFGIVFSFFLFHIGLQQKEKEFRL